MARSYYSTVFETGADRVWAAARDFNGLATWWSHAIRSSRIEDGKGNDQVGAMRNFQYGDVTIRERLRSLSDVERSCSYDFGDPRPFPVANYLATLRVTPITDGGRSFVEWWATFDCKEEEREHWTAFFAAEAFAPALQGLRTYLAENH